MEEVREWVRAMAGVVTVASFVGNLHVAYRVWHAQSSYGIAFFPLGLAVLCSNAWMLYGRAAGDSTVMWANACSLALVGFVAMVHRAFARDTGPGGTVVMMLLLVYITVPVTTVEEHGNLAVIFAVACDLQAVARIWRKELLPNAAAWRLSTGVLWTLHGVFSLNVRVFLGNFVGVVVAAAELILAVWYVVVGRR
ncbi:hypothetical protein MTO96_004812 [Rhipicephalus appendiculatus]